MDDKLAKALSTSSTTSVRQSGICNKIKELRQEITRTYPFIHRLAIARYHDERDTIQTYAFDEQDSCGLFNYETKLSQCSALQALSRSGQARVINDMAVFDRSEHRHAMQLRRAGYQSSYTVPLIVEGTFIGFMFANSKLPNVMTGDVVERLRLTAIICGLLLHQDLAKVGVLRSTVESMKAMGKYRDPETGEHQQRMACFSLLIAREVAEAYQLSDSFIEYLYLYAPLHDLGKMTIADNILLKPGELTPVEFCEMKRHAGNGGTLAKKMITIFHLSEMPFIDMLLNIIYYHHEKVNGQGYPRGLVGSEIPVEARIIAVADVFDALTSERPYKKAWTNEAAFDELDRLSGEHLDPICVRALIDNKSQVAEIQQSFVDGLGFLWQ